MPIRNHAQDYKYIEAVNKIKSELGATELGDGTPDAFKKILDDMNYISLSSGDASITTENLEQGIEKLRDTAKKKRDLRGGFVYSEETKMLYKKIKKTLEDKIKILREKEFLPSLIVPASVFPQSLDCQLGVMSDIKRRVVEAEHRIDLSAFLEGVGESGKLKTDNLYTVPPTRSNIIPKLDKDDPGIEVVEKQVQQMNMCLAKAGVADRTLYDEVAFTEMCLVRNTMNLRVLVLRYAKAVLAVTGTTIVAFVIVGALETSCHYQHVWWMSPLLWVPAWYLIWAFWINQLVTSPLRWIHSGTNSIQDGKERSTPDDDNDSSLMHSFIRIFKSKSYHERSMKTFETIVLIAAYFAGFCAALALIIAGFALADQNDRASFSRLSTLSCSLSSEPQIASSNLSKREAFSDALINSETAEAGITQSARCATAAARSRLRD